MNVIYPRSLTLSRYFSREEIITVSGTSLMPKLLPPPPMELPLLPSTLAVVFRRLLPEMVVIVGRVQRYREEVNQRMQPKSSWVHLDHRR